MRTDFTREAQHDLSEIADYIALDNPDRAVSFVNELSDKAISIAEHPRIYAVVPGRDLQGIRRCVHGAYSIFYQIGPGRITILHILHGARDYESLL